MKIKKNRRWFRTALISGALVLLCFYFFQPPVPSYAGMDANFWFDTYVQHGFRRTSSTSSADYVAAFRDMGGAVSPFLEKKLERADSWERWYAAHVAGAPDWVQKLLPAPVDWAARRDSAMFLLIVIGPSAKEAVPKLIPFYSKLRQRSINNAYPRPVNGARYYDLYADKWICTRILKVLGSAGADDPRALAVLIQALGDQDMSTAATQALEELARKDQHVISRLHAELSSTNSVARQSSASALRSIGPAAKQVVAKLKERVTIESDKRIRFIAADALWKIDQQAYAVIPFRLEELAMHDDSMRWNAAACLGEYGTQSESAIPALMELLKDPNNRIRGIAAIALGKIGPLAKDAVPALTEALKDEYTNVQEAAAEALKKIQQSEIR